MWLIFFYFDYQVPNYCHMTHEQDYQVPNLVPNNKLYFSIGLFCCYSELQHKMLCLQVNALCADRGVFFTYVDLRWGITEEQTCHGKTIAICLQEVAHKSCARTFFIKFSLPSELFGNYCLLKRSVTKFNFWPTFICSQILTQYPFGEILKINLLYSQIEYCKSKRLSLQEFALQFDKDLLQCCARIHVK